VGSGAVWRLLVTLCSKIAKLDMSARPKYQVFISSTYSDLREEREAVTWAILSARLIPAGMENFTATDDRGWQTIKSVIDRSDYYVLLIAGRYGSTDDDGKSWTEKEYEYAVSRGIPILAFLRDKKSITVDKIEDSTDLKSKLENFKGRVTSRHLCDQWNEKTDLVGKVTSALRNQITDDEDGGRSRPGWYRGDELPSIDTLDEFARLSKENARLQGENEALKASSELTSRLVLLDETGKALPASITTRRPLKIYHPALRSLEAMRKANYGAEFFVMNIVQILQLRVHNVSNTVVEHICVDLLLEPVLGFHCGWSGAKLLERHGNLTNSTVEVKYKYQYPDQILLINPECISIRVRVPLVSAGGTEDLPKLLVLGAVKRKRSWFNLTYKVVGSAGQPASGAAVCEVIFDKSQKINEQELNSDRREFQQKYEIYVSSNMIFKK
jgi:hypothetical protein